MSSEPIIQMVWHGHFSGKPKRAFACFWRVAASIFDREHTADLGRNGGAKAFVPNRAQDGPGTGFAKNPWRRSVGSAALSGSEHRRSNAP